MFVLCLLIGSYLSAFYIFISLQKQLCSRGRLAQKESVRFVNFCFDGTQVQTAQAQVPGFFQAQ